MPKTATSRVEGLETGIEVQGLKEDVNSNPAELHRRRPPLHGGGACGDEGGDRQRGEKLERWPRHAGKETYEPGVSKTQRCDCHTEMERGRAQGAQV